MKWQLCPKCNGQGTVSKPPHIAGDQIVWSGSSCAFPCMMCYGQGKILEPVSVDFHGLLTRYSQWLHDCGYIDADWYAEEPNAVDRFLQEEGQ